MVFVIQFDILKSTVAVIRNIPKCGRQVPMCDPGFKKTWSLGMRQ